MRVRFRWKSFWRQQLNLNPIDIGVIPLFTERNKSFPEHEGEIVDYIRNLRIIDEDMKKKYFSYQEKFVLGEVSFLLRYFLLQIEDFNCLFRRQKSKWKSNSNWCPRFLIMRKNHKWIVSLRQKLSVRQISSSATIRIRIFKIEPMVFCTIPMNWKDGCTIPSPKFCSVRNVITDFLGQQRFHSIFHTIFYHIKNWQVLLEEQEDPNPKLELMRGDNYVAGVWEKKTAVIVGSEETNFVEVWEEIKNGTFNFNRFPAVS